MGRSWTPRAPSARASLHSLGVELWLAAAAIAAERAGFADRIGALEDPVLPRGQAAENLGLHGLGAAEPQIGLEPGEAVRREARALLQEDTDLVLPVELVEGECDEPAGPRR